MALTARQESLNRRYGLYIAAEEAVLSGQSYTIGNRSLTRADLGEIRDAIDDLESKGAPFDDTAKTRRAMRIVFRD